MSANWSQIKERGNYWGINLLAQIYRHGGRFIMVPLLYLVVFYFFVSRASTRKHSHNYLRRVAQFSPVSYSLWGVWQHYMSFADSLVFRVAAWMGKTDNVEVSFPQRQKLLDAFQDGHGLIALSAHIGNLEMCRAFVGRSKVRINIIVATEHTASFNRMLRQFNPETNVNLIPMHSVSPATAIELQERLQRGESIVIMADRVSANSHTRVLNSNLLNDKISLPEGPFRLALALAHPVVFMSCVRTAPNKFEIMCEAIRPAPQQHGRKAKLQDMANQYSQQLEHLCKAHPKQWFNFYDYWDDEHNNNTAL